MATKMIMKRLRAKAIGTWRSLIFISTKMIRATRVIPYIKCSDGTRYYILFGMHSLFIRTLNSCRALITKGATSSKNQKNKFIFLLTSYFITKQNKIGQNNRSYADIAKVNLKAVTNLE